MLVSDLVVYSKIPACFRLQRKYVGQTVIMMLAKKTFLTRPQKLTVPL